MIYYGSDKKKILDFYFEYTHKIDNQKNKEYKPNEKVIEEKTTPKTYKYTKLFNSTLLILALDLLFLFVIIFPICSIIDLYKLKNGFIYVFQIIIIAYQCDNGALLFGKLFGKRKFGHPITPTKTYEGIFGAFFLG